jgi:hypothetical protein
MTDVAAIIAGNAVYVPGGSISAQNAIGQRSTASFAVLDETGAAHYQQGMPVSVTDENGTIVFGGVVDKADEQQPSQDAALYHAISCVDWHYLADKRRAAVAYASQTVGFIANDLIDNYLFAEGVTDVLNLHTANQSDVETDTSGFAAFGGGGGSMTRDTAQHWHGAASLKLVMDGTGGFQFVNAQILAGAYVVGATYTASFYIMCDAPSVGALLRYFVDSDSGAVSGVSTLTLSATWTRYTITFTVPAGKTWIGIRLDTGSTPHAATFWIDGLQMEPGALASVWKLGGSSSVQTGPTVTEFTSNYAKVSECLDALAQAAGFYWQIDVNKILWLAAPGTVAGPNVTADIIEQPYPQITHTNPLYRDRQFILGGKAQTSSQVETRIGDGNTQSYAMSYPLATAPTVEVMLSGGSFVAKTVGIGGVDSGKDWYWNKGKNEVFQDSAGTKLRGPTGTVDTLRVTYVGEFPTVIQSDDVGEQLTTQAREGAGTGIVEDVVTDSNLSTLAAGFELAASYLAKYARLGKSVTFRTDQAGFAQGQLVDVYLPAFGILHESMLIESVSITHDGLTFWYMVKALAGPINTTWVTFFANLIAKASGTVDKINLGSSSSVAISTSFTASKSPSASFVATVNACMFPSATAYPSTSTYPC